MPLTVFTQRNFVADFLQAKSDFFTQIGRFAFLRPPLGDLGATYDDHLRLIGKRIVDFLLALIELFSLGVTAEALRAIIGSKFSVFFLFFLNCQLTVLSCVLLYEFHIK